MPCWEGRDKHPAQAPAHAEALPQSTAWRPRLLGEQTRVTGAQGVGTGMRDNEEAEEAERLDYVGFPSGHRESTQDRSRAGR